MSSRQSGVLSNVQDRRGVLNIGANPTGDVRLPYTQIPPDSHPNQAKYPPRHPGRGVPPIISQAHGIHLNHDPEQAHYWRMPPNSSETSIQKRTLTKPNPGLARPADGKTSQVRECFIDDDRDGCLTFLCSYGSYTAIPLSCVGLCSSSPSC